MSWYRVTYAQRDFLDPDTGRNFLDPDTLYQSPDFPHVFLGGADEEKFDEVEQKAGQPVCIRIDLRSDSGSERSMGLVPDAQMSVPLPDDPSTQPEHMDHWHQVFDQTVNQVANIISTNDCPIYVHCSAGMNRSVATLVAALSKLTNKPFYDVLAEMQAIRSLAHPNETYLAWGEQATREPPEENLNREVA